jgi:hypothetical protein
VLGLAVGNDNVYWTYSEQGLAYLAQMPVTGGARSQLRGALNPPNANGVVVNATETEVYCTNFRLYAEELSDGGVQNTPFSVCGGGAPHSLTINGSTLACTGEADNMMEVWDSNGLHRQVSANAVQALGGKDIVANGIAIQSGMIYWNSGTDIVGTPMTGTDPGSVLVSSVTIKDLVANASGLFWTGACGGPPGVCKSGLSGGKGTTIAMSSTPGDMAIDASDIYWANNINPGGSILRVGLNGGNATTLASNQAGPFAVAVGTDAVYWVNGVTNEIMKVAK